MVPPHQLDLAYSECNPTSKDNTKKEMAFSDNPFFKDNASDQNSGRLSVKTDQK